MTELDVRGLSCPEPVLLAMDEMDANPSEDLLLLSDAAHTRDNLLKLAESENRRAEVTESKGYYEIRIYGKH